MLNFTKWSNTLKQFVGNLSTNCLSVFDCFVGLTFKGLRLELMYITLSQFLYINSNEYILHRKYQVKYHSSLRFSAVYVAALVHRNHFFICTINLVNLKESSYRLVIVENRFLKMPNLHMLIKQKSPLLTRNLALVTFDELPIVFSTKVNLL